MSNINISKETEIKNINKETETETKTEIKNINKANTIIKQLYKVNSENTPLYYECFSKFINKNVSLV
jgi:hypothetical protein